MDVQMTNADEVAAFLADHPRGVNFEEGDRLVLPDIEQEYVVRAVRPVRSKSRWRIYLEFEATCAVDGCGERFIFTKVADEFRTSPYLVRTCAAHRRAWSTPMANAWKTTEEIELMEAARASSRAEREERRSDNLGVNERVVLSAIRDLALLADEASVDAVVRHAVRSLPAPASGQRDTRRQTVMRALRNVAKKGHAQLGGDRVIL